MRCKGGLDSHNPQPFIVTRKMKDKATGEERQVTSSGVRCKWCKKKFGKVKYNADQ